MIQGQVQRTQGGHGGQMEMAVIPFVESALDWKSTRFETPFAASLSNSPKGPKVVRKIVWHTCEVNLCKI